LVGLGRGEEGGGGVGLKRFAVWLNQGCCTQGKALVPNLGNP
jgi:hypothetical protein